MFQNSARRRPRPTIILVGITQDRSRFDWNHNSFSTKLLEMTSDRAQRQFQRPLVYSTSPAENDSCSTVYGTIANMPDSQSLASSENKDTRSAGRMPLEFEASTERQRRSSKSIRLYAIILCTTISLGSFLVCHINGRANTQLANSSGKQSTEKAYKMSNVQQPKRLEEDPEYETIIQKLRDEFHEWVEHHSRDYGSDEEKEKRFHIWKENHFRTQDKNELHGPCKMTGQAVFGSNHFKDLTPKEFQAKYLTGYTGPHTNDLTKHKRHMRSDQFMAEDILKTSPATKRRIEPSEVLSSNGLHDPSVLSNGIDRHESVQERYLQYIQQAPILDKTYYNKEEKQNEKTCNCGSNYYGSRRNRRLSERKSHPLFGKTYYNKNKKQYLCGGYSKTYYNSGSSSSVDCSKYKLEAGQDFETSNEYEYGQGSCVWYDFSCWLRGIFQPIYTTSSERFYSNYNYPSSMDWRTMGAVTAIHSQGSCGACWAITAVETIESANYIATGQLFDLSEQEIIVCDDSCEMCNGGWPQNAYSYVMENNGLPKDSSYDGDLLMTMTTVKEGQSDELTENEMESILESTCPASSSGSQKNSNTSSKQRYAEIQTYAYATDRCVCYTDGSGCDCSDQNEALAVMNVASFGPATVCLEASTWQDYSGGIITADSGCSSGFLDMNHCVQAVGYAFQEVDSDGDEGEGDESKSGDGGTKQLEGYWIIRNQWSSYWGMSGYAYVAMGSNTCGVLNDMTQVFV